MIGILAERALLARACSIRCGRYLGLQLSRRATAGERFSRRAAAAAPAQSQGRDEMRGFGAMLSPRSRLVATIWVRSGS